MAKSQQLQIRVSREEKRRIEVQARRAGMAVSAYVLEKLLPSVALEFARLCEQLARATQPAFVYAELNDFLSALARNDFAVAVAEPPALNTDPLRLNYLAAMVEHAAGLLAVSPPAWTRDVAPLDTPIFASELAGVRLHLLINALPPFRRRNLFVDTAVGGRV